MYYNEENGQFLTKEEFVQLAIRYINSKEWEDGGTPSVKEVMLNMDNIIEIDE